ncbi:FAD-dependent oxidoreductase [Acrocarpospora sp. B8E8]|uniref:phytoene desaturase family protein n=1 Tax=Acrocarpospora sp. B8E8 TaxID=3153572 RepID=UPI00325F08E5
MAHDTIVVGGGIGGLITGALLAAKDRRSVLVLEKENTIGGRVMSFGGHHGSPSAEEYRRTLKGAANVRIVHTEPALEEIVDDHKIFDRFILDPGWHTVGATGRNRFSLLAKALGKSIPVAPQIGFYFDSGDGFVDLKDVSATWPEESRREHRRVAAERVAISPAESARYDHIDLLSYVNMVTEDQLVRDYYLWLGRFVLALNDPTEGSAGEFIRTNNLPIAAGMHLSHGGGNGEVCRGFKTIADVFAEIIRENGGEIRTGTPVRQVLLDRNRATGVEIDGPAGPERIDAQAVIVNLPMDAIGRVVPIESFPAELRERIAKIYSAVGMTGFIGVKELIEPARPTGVFLIDPLPQRIPLKGGDAWLAFEQTTALDPTRRVGAAEGHYLQTWTVLHAKGEATDDELLRRISEAHLDFFRSRYPGFDENMEWAIFTQADRIYGAAPAPGIGGDRRPPVQHPLVPNLFFTGDTVTQTDVGTNGAAHGAILCANAVAGRDFLPLLPDYLR